MRCAGKKNANKQTQTVSKHFRTMKNITLNDKTSTYVRSRFDDIFMFLHVVSLRVFHFFSSCSFVNASSN